jgi:S-layer homology domain
MRRTAKRRQPRNAPNVRTWGAGLLAMLTLVAAQQSRHLWGSLSETVCVSVTVIGLESVPLGGNEPCVEAPAESSSSASSTSSASSSAGSAGGVISTNEGTGTVTDGEIGGRRHSIPQSMERTRQLLEEWSKRHLRSAATCMMPYVDVAVGRWFRPHVLSFYCKGYLDTNTIFRPMENATRAEMTKLLVRMSGGLSGPAPTRRGFDDVEPSSWYYPYVEEAAKRGWMKGYGDCYGTRPCFTKPEQPVTRAEAAAMIVRFFALPKLGTSTPFPDVKAGAWYAEPVMIAADHCILRGDDVTRRVRPDAHLNRAEMVSVLDRTEHELISGIVCDPEYPPAAFEAVMIRTESAQNNAAGTRTAKPQMEAAQPVPQAPLGERCQAMSYSCLAEAVMADSIDLLASLLAASFPSRTAVNEASPSELMMWTGMLATMVVGSFIASCVLLHRLNARRNRLG